MIDIFENKAAKKHAVKPALSVLIPYYKDNPIDLLKALLEQTNTDLNVEVLIYDDGTNDIDVNRPLQQAAALGETPVRLFFAKENKGRSTARNTLTDNARADWILFLDADMLPKQDSFLEKYLSIIGEGNADVIFGGFSVQNNKASPDTELHRAFSQTSDCLSAEERMKSGPQFVCSSNLCVRADVLKTDPFDTGFTGWGWEDSEWAARIAKKYRLRHSDIPALHLGLESTEILLSRFRDSADNYVYFTSKHPELAKTLTLYKLSHKLKRIPGQKLSRPVLAFVVRTKKLPTRLRLLALKLWRASWYAEAFS